MALPFLEAFIQDFAPAQRAALERISRSETSTLGEDEVAALLAKVQEGTKPLFESPEFGLELLDGCKMNTALAALKADLSALLLQAQELEQVSVKHENIHQAMVRKLHQSVLRLDEVILTNKTRRLNPDITEVKFIDFFNARNEASTKRRAIVEQDTGQLVGAPITSSRYMNRGGELKPRLTTRVISSGVNPDSGKAFLPDEASKPGNSYVWAEVLLADSKVNATFQTVDYNGAVVELIVDLPQAEDINEFKLAPFGKFPLDLIAAEYDDGSQWTSIGLTLPLTLEFDTTAIRFDPINARRLRFVFHQKDFTFKEFVLERGQIKRTNYLNVMLDRALEDQLSQEPTGTFKLRDSRRKKAKAALDEALKNTDAEDSQERYAKAIKKIVDIDNTKAVRIAKYQYVVGLRALEINYKRYSTLSEYKAPPLQANSSIFELQLETSETQQTNADGNPVTTVEWYLDIGGGETLDILPDNATTIVEVLKFDAKRVADTRFTVATGTSDVTAVYRDGELLTVTTDYTLSSGAGQVVEVTITPAGWNPASVYYIEYTPETDQQLRNLMSGRFSIKPIKPEVFNKTNGNLNRIDLRAHPFVLPEIASSPDRWSRPDPFDAIWEYSPPMSRSAANDPPFIVGFDGEFYGETPIGWEADDTAGGAILSSTDPIRVQDNSANPSQMSGAITGQVPGIVQIEAERILYRGITVSFPSTEFEIDTITRGYDNTEIVASYAADTPVRWVTKKDYRPIEVKYNGVHCRNLTDYENGKHPAFVDRGGPPQYIQIGSSLFFDRPLSGRIEVEYRRLVDFLQLRANMYSLDVNREHTPMVDYYAFKLKSATL